MTWTIGVAYRILSERPEVRHINFVLCDVLPSDPRIVVVNFTTGSYGCPTLRVGTDEYGELTETSMIAFKGTRMATITALDQALRLGEIQRADTDVSQELVKKVRRAALKSDDTPESRKHDIRQRLRHEQEQEEKKKAADKPTPPPDPSR